MAGIEFGWCCELEEYTEPEDGKDCIGWRSNKKPSKRERKIKRGMTVFMRSLNGKKDGGKR